MNISPTSEVGPSTPDHVNNLILPSANTVAKTPWSNKPARIVSAQVEFGSDAGKLEVFNPATKVWDLVAKTLKGQKVRGIFKLPAAAGQLPKLIFTKNVIGFSSDQKEVSRLNIEGGKATLQMETTWIRDKNNKLNGAFDDLKVTFDQTELEGTHFASLGPGLSPELPADAAKQLDASKLSERAKEYLKTVVNPEISASVLNSDAMQNTLKSLSRSYPVAANAVELSKIDGAARWEMLNKKGGTFVLKGDHKINRSIELGDGVTVYIDGKIHKDGTFSAANFNKENETDTIFHISGKSNVKLIGLKDSVLSSNGRSTGVYVDNSDNVTVKGLQIKNVWEGITVKWGAKNTLVEGNYIQDAAKRGIWSLGTNDSSYVRNFIENVGADSIDVDAYDTRTKAFENVFLGWDRWALFTEEGAQNTEVVKNVAIMAKFPHVHPDPAIKDAGPQWTMGFADNGSTDRINRPTDENYFIGNDVWRPDVYTYKQSSGDYFSRRNDSKGKIYFWNNGGNVGHTAGSVHDTPDRNGYPNDIWNNTNLSLQPWGGNRVAALEKKYVI